MSVPLQFVLGAPECMSYTFNAAGKCTSYTGGYVMDRRVGNTKGLGAMFGILAAIGGPVLAPGSFTFMTLVAANKVQKFFGSEWKKALGLWLVWSVRLRHCLQRFLRLFVYWCRRVLHTSSQAAFLSLH